MRASARPANAVAERAIAAQADASGAVAEVPGGRRAHTPLGNAGLREGGIGQVAERRVGHRRRGERRVRDLAVAAYAVGERLVVVVLLLDAPNLGRPMSHRAARAVDPPLGVVAIRLGSAYVLFGAVGTAARVGGKVLQSLRLVE